MYFRNINLHPICLPDWERQDSEGKYTYDKLYRYNKWEKYQVLYSLKAMHKDVRFYNVWTDVNGPSKFLVKNSVAKCISKYFKKCLFDNFQKCSDSSDKKTNWKTYCNVDPYKVMKIQRKEHFFLYIQ